MWSKISATLDVDPLSNLPFQAIIFIFIHYKPRVDEDDLKWVKKLLRIGKQVFMEIFILKPLVLVKLGLF